MPTMSACQTVVVDVLLQFYCVLGKRGHKGTREKREKDNTVAHQCCRRACGFSFLLFGPACVLHRTAGSGDTDSAALCSSR